MAPAQCAIERLTATSTAHYLAFSPDGRTLAVGHAGRRGVLLWDVARGEGRNLEVPGITYSGADVRFTPDGRTLAVTTCAPGNVFVVDLTSGVARKLDFDRANALAVSPDGKLLAVAGHDDSLRLFSLPDGQPRGAYFWHTMAVNDVAFSPNGRWLATTSDDQFVKLWPVAALTESRASPVASAPGE